MTIQTPSSAVDSAVLFYLSRSGGTNTGSALTIERLGRILRADIPADELHALMVNAAERAAEHAETERRTLAARIAHELSRLNSSIDSASLDRYIDRLESAA